MILKRRAKPWYLDHPIYSVLIDSKMSNVLQLLRRPKQYSVGTCEFNRVPCKTRGTSHDWSRPSLSIGNNASQLSYYLNANGL